jgi:hypothetical protein
VCYCKVKKWGYWNDTDDNVCERISVYGNIGGNYMMASDLSLEAIYQIARANKHTKEKDNVYVYLKNQNVVQESGEEYENIIKKICDELNF